MAASSFIYSGRGEERQRGRPSPGRCFSLCVSFSVLHDMYYTVLWSGVRTSGFCSSACGRKSRVAPPIQQKLCPSHRSSAPHAEALLHTQKLCSSQRSSAPAAELVRSTLSRCMTFHNPEILSAQIPLFGHFISSSSVLHFSFFLCSRSAAPGSPRVRG